ncbi:hypothetical protein [Risungbinella massiliensis]|uniref:hypothetical protein n=1 Tax=Risungbinella massiliensis TaxID=1329796 RepID=UPI0005CB85AD|nr:hypothetical protein [Risungbinella massiliensis]
MCRSLATKKTYFTAKDIERRLRNRKQEQRIIHYKPELAEICKAIEDNILTEEAIEIFRSIRWESKEIAIISIYEKANEIRKS